MAITVVGNTATASTSVVRLRLSVAVAYPALSANATAPTALAATSAVQLRATAAADILTLLASAVVPAADISYIKLTLGAALDTTGRFKFIADAAVVLDALSYSFRKLFGDAASPIDTKSLTLAKPLAHVAYATDSLMYAVGKKFADTFGVPDTAARALAKAAFDAYGFSDHSVFSLAKLVKDGVGMNDSFDLGDGSVYSFVKSISNVAFANDQLRRDVAKSLQDSVAAASLAALAVSKAPFADATAVADTATLATALRKFDTVAPVDFTARDVAKLLVDVYVVVDALSQAIEKSLSDSVAATDSATLRTNKPLADYVATTDAAALGVDVALTDSVGFVDFVVAVLVVIRDFADAVSVADAASFQTDKGTVFELLAAADATSLLAAKVLADGVGMNDLADIGDGLTVDFAQTVANVAFMADNSARLPQLSKADTAAVADSGSLVNQGYCDLTYFAEDYVGAARSF